MNLITKVDSMFLGGILAQHFKNQDIETNATLKEGEAIELIKEYSHVIDYPVWGNVGRGMPPSTPQPESNGEIFSDEFLAMKDFLESHPDYSTRAANNIRKFYSLENTLS